MNGRQPVTTERDELAAVFDQHQICGYGDGVVACMCGAEIPVRGNSDEHYLSDHIADVILTAGYRKSRTVTTVEELDALPELTTLLDSDGDVARKFRDGWRVMVVEPFDAAWLSDGMECVALPATVLHIGGTE